MPYSERSHDPRPHRRTACALPRGPADCCPIRSNIDLYRSITALEQPREPHRDSRPGTDRHAPFRRVALRRPPPAAGSGRITSLLLRPTVRGDRAPDRRPRFRRRIPRSAHQDLVAPKPDDPDRVEPEEGRLPPRSDPRPYIDNHRCLRRPRRRLPRRLGHPGDPSGRRELRLRSPDRRGPPCPGRTPRPVDQPASISGGAGFPALVLLGHTPTNPGLHLSHHPRRYANLTSNKW